MKVYGLCPTGKVGYLDAIDAALTLEELKSKDRTEANSYPCTQCDLWHLTSGPVE